MLKLPQSLQKTKAITFAMQPCKRLTPSLWLCLLLQTLCTVALAADKGTDGTLTALKPDDLRVVQAGEVVYHANCASCHGKYLEGAPNWRQRDENGYLPAPPHDETGHTWHHADDLLFEITKYGPGAVIGDSGYKTLMPAYQYQLSDEDIIAVLSFIKNSWPLEQREWQDKMNGNDPSTFDSASDSKSTLMEKLFGD